MPIASGDCPCDTSADVCCDTLYLKLDRIRTVAWNAVLDCRDETCGCTGTMANTYTFLGPQSADPFGESVICVYGRTTPLTTTRGGHTAQVSAHRIECRVEVRCSGWPIQRKDGDRIVLPTPDEWNNATRYVLGHAEKAYRAVFNAAQSNTLFTQTPGIIFKGQRVTDLVAIQPRSYIAGAAFGVHVDVAL